MERTVWKGDYPLLDSRGKRFYRYARQGSAAALLGAVVVAGCVVPDRVSASIIQQGITIVRTVRAPENVFVFNRPPYAQAPRCAQSKLPKLSQRQLPIQHDVREPILLRAERCPAALLVKGGNVEIEIGGNGIGQEVDAGGSLDIVGRGFANIHDGGEHLKLEVLPSSLDEAIPRLNGYIGPQLGSRRSNLLVAGPDESASDKREKHCGNGSDGCIMGLQKAGSTLKSKEFFEEEGRVFWLLLLSGTSFILGCLAFLKRC